MYYKCYPFRPYHGPGVDSAPSENEYQEHLLGVKGAGAWGWPHHLHVLNVMKFGSLNLLDPSGSHRVCYGTLLTFITNVIVCWLHQGQAVCICQNLKKHTEITSDMFTQSTEKLNVAYILSLKSKCKFHCCVAEKTIAKTKRSLCFFYVLCLLLIARSSYTV
jgi:hypothetical protein